MNSKLTSILYDEGIYQIPEDSSFIKENEEPGEGLDFISFQAVCIIEKSNDENLELLNKIMSAINLAQGDFKILEGNLNFDSLNSKSIFIFTDSSFQNFPYYEWKESNERRVLKSESLNSLRADIEKKKKLWSVLKN